MEKKDFKPDILDGEILQIWSEPGIVVINSPAASFKIAKEDWPTARADLQKLK